MAKGEGSPTSLANRSMRQGTERLTMQWSSGFRFFGNPQVGKSN